MKLSPISYFVLLSCLCLTILSCSKNRCIKLEEGPTYEVEKESKAYVNHYYNSFVGPTRQDEVVFKNSVSEEVVFDLEVYTILKPYSRRIACGQDNSQFVSQNGKSESINVSLYAPHYDYFINIRLSPIPGTDPTVEEPDELYIGNGKSMNSGKWDPILIHYIDANLNYSIIKDSIILNGQTYYNVIEVNPDNPGFDEPFNPPFEVKYTKELGIIYLHDKINDKELFYDRIE